MNYDRYFTNSLARLRDEHRYRNFVELERVAGQFPRAIWHASDGPRDIVVWPTQQCAQFAAVHEFVILCRVADAGHGDASTRTNSRRRQLAKGRNRGRWSAEGASGAMGI